MNKCSCLDTRSPPLVKAARIGKWQRWFLALKPGDAVWLQFPWQDRKRPGGRRVIATVGRATHPKVRVFRYRQVDGSRHAVSFKTCQGDCYTHVIPIGFELRYAPKRGYLLVQEPVASSGSRRQAA